MKTHILLFINIIFLTSISFGQETNTNSIIAFYNVENLFHPTDDSLTNDEAYTPTGLNHWSFKKYYKKVSNIAKVFIAMGKGNPPAVIGLAEIENEQVLQDLCYRSPLRAFHYKYVHHDSPDRRGVDVALLYRDSIVRILREHKVSVVFPFEPQTRNRDLLYVCVQLPNGDSLHILVNHWTSRFGGYAATIPKRNYYADVARHWADSLLTANATANILIMGDFNDYPTDESLLYHLNAKHYPQDSATASLFNLMFHFERLNNVGSHKHEDFWGCLDQLIVSKSLLTPSNGLHIKDNQPHIFDSDFLLVPDEKYGGYKNYRTFLGPRYIGGFSDHLPVYLEILVSGKS